MADEEFTLTIDFNSLTLGEIDEIEDRLEMSIGDIGEALSNGGKGVRMGKMLRAFALIKMRRTNPLATWEDTANVMAPKVAPTLDPPSPPSVPIG